MLITPPGMRALLVLAHGAGAGMRHPFLEQFAQALAAVGIGTLRYEFPYMEAKKHRVDSPAVATARVREAVAEAVRVAPGVPLYAGGKSFGGRMTSTAQAEAQLEGVRGLVFVGFPLHPPGKPGIERAAHLADVQIPMLFLQGTRDEFALRDLLEPVVQGLGDRAALVYTEGGDHSFKVKGRKPAEVIGELAGAVTSWRVREVES
jgi:hypothetical protein